jgi:hypothetical protein
MTAARRDLRFDDFDQLMAEVRTLQSGGYRRCGNWTLSQVCDHLAIFLRGSMRGFPTQMPWILRVTVGRFFLRRILRKKKMPTGFKVPGVYLPGDPVNDLAAVEAFLKTVREYRDYSGRPAPSPFAGPLTRDEWDRLHLIHAAHHLSFLQPGK